MRDVAMCNRLILVYPPHIGIIWVIDNHGLDRFIGRAQKGPYRRGSIKELLVRPHGTREYLVNGATGLDWDHSHSAFQREGHVGEIPHIQTEI